MKKIFTFLALLVLSMHLTYGQGTEPRPFITTWTIESSDLTHALTMTAGNDYDFSYVWKDAANEDVFSGTHTSADGDFSTTFTTAGTYTLEIVRTFPHFYMGTSFTNRKKLADVKQWGDIAWQSMRESFRSFQGSVFTATDAPDLSNVTDMSRMFEGSSFNQDINDWNVEKVTNMSRMFLVSSFNQDISGWNVEKVTDMSRMFEGSSFNQNIGGWNVGNVTDMSSMFQVPEDGAITPFNQDIGGWNVENVTDMNRMFIGSAFNQDIGGWKVDNVTDMSFMFSSSAFNQDIGGWNVEKVTNMGRMFERSPFNQNIGGWNVGNVTDMSSMFNSSAFNQDIGGWNVSNVTQMNFMFQLSSFNQDLSGWNVSAIENTGPFSSGMKDMFTDSGLSADNYDKTLIGWQARGGLKDNVELGARNRTYCKSGFARGRLISDFNWQITDGGQFCPFITSWGVSRISGATDVKPVTLKLTDGLTYNFNYIWRNAQGDKVSSGNITSANVPSSEFVFSNFPASGEYTLEITGLFPHFSVDQDNIEKLIDVKQWGDIAWQSMKESFRNFLGSAFTATDAPNLTSVTDMSGMFQGSSFNQDISSWNVSSVEDMNSMFAGSTFNQDIGGWNVSKVTTMANMFTNGALSTRNYDNMLIGWAKRTNLQNGVVLNVNSYFCNASSAKTTLATLGWQITDLGQSCSPFITIWNIGNAAIDKITLKFTTQIGYNFNYIWKNAQGDEVSSGTIISANVPSREFVSSNFPASGVYTLEITGVFPHLNIKEDSVDKLIDVKQWGNIAWKSMESSFENWQGTSFSATDTPNLREVSSMKSLFSGAVNFNGAIGNWDVSNITDMSTMFKGSGFNQDISGWKIVKVTTMENMFLDGQLSTKNYDKMLIGWNNLALEEVINSQVKLGVGTTTYCEAGIARTNLILDLLWEFTDGGENCPSDETDILSFTLAEQTGAAIIDNIAHTVEIEVASTADITSLQIFMTLSPGAESNPVSGATVNFTLPESFIVTAADGVVQEWTIFVTQEEPSLGVPEQEQLQVSVYPNPFEEEVYIKAAKPFSITLTNMSGAHLRQAKSAGELQLNLAGLSSGMYLLVIKNEDGVTTQKLVKK